MRAVLSSIGLVRQPTLAERVVAFVIRWAFLSAAVWVAAAILDGIHLGGWESAIVVGLVLGLLNAVLHPLMFWISLPLTALTLGLFLIVINTALLGLTVWISGAFDYGSFEIDGVLDAVFGALIISAVGWVLGFLVDPDETARDVAG